MDAEYDGAARVAAGTTYWSFTKDNGYGILDADGNENPGLMSALVPPHPARVAGTPTSCHYDELTRTFTLCMTADPRIAAPTEIGVPPRIYPAGVDISCGGCDVEVAAGRVLLGELPSTGNITVLVTPL